jgi:capsular polysaccharide transport system permease protein
MVEEAPKKAEAPTSEVPNPQDVTAISRLRTARAPAPAKVVPDDKPPVPSEDEKRKVVHIVRRLQEEASQRRRPKSKPWMVISILACIVLPTLLAGLYYVFIASDRYVSEARFAVRSNQAQAADVLGLFTSGPASTVVSDSYIVTDYVTSREMVQTLEQRMPFRQMYSDPKIDFLSRLDPTISLEKLVEYWTNHVDIFYDSTKNTISVQVQAYTAADADRITHTIVDVIRNLVNDLSAQARRDAVQFASAELARAELRVKDARKSMLEFRLTHNELDPTQSAAAKLGVITGLEAQRSEETAKLAAIAPYLGQNAPQVKMYKSRIQAIEEEIARVESKVSTSEDSDLGPGDLGPGLAGGSGVQSAPAGKSEPMANVIGKYQEILLDQEFAEKGYAAAEASLERARVEADRAQSYLALYVTPTVAQEALYPRRFLNILLVLTLATIVWAIGGLIALTVRDHMS